MATRPNILLITTDQQRYDTLGVNGNPHIATPHLDQLAATGVNFTRAYVTNPVCVASRACIQTGRYTHQHGVEYMEDVVDNTPGLPPWEVTFMERLQAAGYYTGAFGKMHMYPAKGFHEAKLSGGQGARWDKPYGLPLGPSPLGNDYAQWLEARRPGAFAAIHDQRRTEAYRTHGSAVTSPIDLEDYVDTWVAENCRDFLRRRAGADTPFFLWCGFLNPHTPLDAPEPYASRYHPDDVPLPASFLADVSDRPAFYAARQQGFRKLDRPAAEAKIRRMIAYYWGLCTMLDDLSQRLFSTLQELGLWDNTLILYTSDHGDMMGDFAMTGKSNFMEGSIHVPFIAKPPQRAGQPNPAPRHKNELIENELIEVMDVAATILDYAQVPRPERMQATSLRPLLEGAGRGKEQVLCEYTSNDRAIKGKCLRTDRYKYVFWTPGREEELYDMHADPQEFHNLAADPAHQAVLADHRTRLLEHLTRSEQPLLTWL